MYDPAMPIRVKGSCTICSSGLKDAVNAALMAGLPLTRIESDIRAAGRPIKRATIARHRDRCDFKTPEDHRKAKELAKSLGGSTSVKAHSKVRKGSNDFAAMVRDVAIEKLENEELRVTTKDGLAAQALLDRRAEKEKDREFVLNLARLISGAGQPPPESIVEGEFVDLGDGSLLAPPEVRVD